MLLPRIRLSPQLKSSIARSVSTLPSNPHIKVFPYPSAAHNYLLTYLDTEPPSPALAIGSTTEIPPTPKSFSENPRFLDILNEVLAENAHKDEDLKAAAQAFASPGGATSGSGGAFFPHQSHRRVSKGGVPGTGGGGGAEGASGQGGAGGGGMGGWVHLSDRRNPPDFGRIAWPEDILGSVEVDNRGNTTESFQPSGTYRIVTNEGILGLSPFLTQKLISRLREEERKGKDS